jgi:hypothetical protein
MRLDYTQIGARRRAPPRAALQALALDAGDDVGPS